MKVAGIDLSLTSTGLAVINGTAIGVRRITTTGTRDATLYDRITRMHRITETIINTVWDADLVVIEGPSYSSNHGHQHDRSGLWWLLVDHLWTVDGRPVAEVPPTCRAMYATGKGNAGKGAVIDAVTRRYPHVETGGDDNLCDALILASMGARHLGHPIETSLPQTHLRAMDRVAWPEAVTVP